MTEEREILVWDWPVRIGHWLLAGAFAFAWLTGESEEWRLAHVYAGAVVLAVVLFRMLWGFIGTRHARFESFVHGPRAVLGYLLGLLDGRQKEYPGHNPAGGWAILALLALGLLSGVSGWVAYNDIGGELTGEAHEAITMAMLAMVALHIVGVVVSSIAHGLNLPRTLLTGRKHGRMDEAIADARPDAAGWLLAWTAIFAWWLAR